MKIQFDYEAYDLGLTCEDAKGFVELSIDSVISGYDPVSEVVPVFVEEDGTRHHGAVGIYWASGNNVRASKITLKGRSTSNVLSDFSNADSVKFDAIFDYLSKEFSDYAATMAAIEKRGENNLYLYSTNLKLPKQ